MELQVPGNSLAGIYQTSVGKPKPIEEFTLVGWVSNDLIIFSINFGTHGSLTSWSGQHTESKPGQIEIRTLWHLTKIVTDADELNELWSSVLAGANVYVRQ